MLGRLVQSFRSLNLVVFFTVPHFGYFEKQARELIHLKLEAMDKINYKEGKALFMVWKSRVDDWTGKLIPFHPWKVNKDKSFSKLKFKWIRKPSQSWIAAYEKKKLGWQTKDYSKEMVGLVKDMVKQGQIADVDEETINELAEAGKLTIKDREGRKKAKAYVFAEDGTIKTI
jgi:hypothetical protein